MSGFQTCECPQMTDDRQLSKGERFALAWTWTNIRLVICKILFNLSFRIFLYQHLASDIMNWIDVLRKNMNIASLMRNTIGNGKCCANFGWKAGKGKGWKWATGRFFGSQAIICQPTAVHKSTYYHYDNMLILWIMTIMTILVWSTDCQLPQCRIFGIQSSILFKTKYVFLLEF